MPVKFRSSIGDGGRRLRRRSPADNFPSCQPAVITAAWFATANYTPSR